MRGVTWSDASAGLHRKYTQAIRVDSRHSGFLVAGNEEGIFRSNDGGKIVEIRRRGRLLRSCASSNPLTIPATGSPPLREADPSSPAITPHI